jgi:hypothetical protein
MSRAGGALVQADVTVRVPADLRDAFEAKVAVADRKANDVLRELMQAYVDRSPQPEEGYDDWFQQMVQESIDDPRPSVPHEAVIERTTAIIDQVAAGIIRRED